MIQVGTFKHLLRILINNLDGATQPKLSANEMAKVKQFQDHVKGLEYKRLSTKYSTGYNRQRVNQITGRP